MAHGVALTNLYPSALNNLSPMPLSSRKEVTRFVHKKLLFRIRRLAVCFVIIIGIVVYEVVQDYISGYVAFAAFMLGIGIGLLAGVRMHRISWDSETSKAVTRMDRLGIYILIAYLLFAVFRRWIFSHWFHGYALTAFSLSIGAGGMLGRLYTTRQQVRQVLKQEGFLHPRRRNDIH